MTRVAQPPSRPQRRGSSIWLWLAACAVICLLMLVALAGSMWFGQAGSGETRESPDGKYEASAFNKSQGTLRGNRAEWDEIRVTEKATNREVWTVKRQPVPGITPDYGMRGEKFVEWAADSSAVTVDIGGGQKMTFPVP